MHTLHALGARVRAAIIAGVAGGASGGSGSGSGRYYLYLCLYLHISIIQIPRELEHVGLYAH
jgi:hypothetical protein